MSETEGESAEAAENESEQDAKKRRFREALEAKKARGARGYGSDATTGGGIQASSAKTQRQFRRKSG